MIDGWQGIELEDAWREGGGKEPVVGCASRLREGRICLYGLTSARTRRFFNHHHIVACPGSVLSAISKAATTAE